jgi:signal transduction histidine kinase
MNRARQLAREYWFELAIAGLGIAGMLELIVGRDTPGAPTVSLWFSVPAIGALVVPLLFRRRFPFAGPSAYFILAAALSYVDPVLVPFVGSLVLVGLAAAFVLGNMLNGPKAVAGLFISVGAVVIIVWEIPGSIASWLVFIPMRQAVAWAAGFILRERTEQAEAAEERAMQAEREREAAARVAVAEERARIARELHDIVAHAVSVMVLQVGATRHKLPAVLEEEKEALTGVEQAGRRALTEMRRLLAAMRREGDEAELTPQPGLDGLDALLAEINRAGLPVALHVDGEPVPLPRGIDLSAYRIVQEGLTNALKHANASDADVTVRYRPDELEIEIRDNGLGSSTTDGLGHGLVGVRERVKIYGGEMSAGTANGGGFVLSTRLPLGVDER